jgi:hypothetical protein
MRPKTLLKSQHQICAIGADGEHGIKVRKPKVEQTTDEPKGILLPGPDHYTWKRIVNRQRS